MRFEPAVRKESRSEMPEFTHPANFKSYVYPVEV